MLPTTPARNELRSRACLALASENDLLCDRVKTLSFDEIKREEARRRMAARRLARRHPEKAAELQRRASLIGNDAHGRILNLKQVARAMSKWA